MLDVIEKSKSAVTGEIREWSGKKYKKQPNGKWLEVSEHGMIKTEHEEIADQKKKEAMEEGDRYRKEQGNKYRGFSGGTSARGSSLFAMHRAHKEVASKLSDKEHSDEGVGLSEKTREKLEKEIEKLKYNDQYGKSSIEEHVRLMNAKKELSELK